jgi:NAD(P)-dependent dehydrogenase (short-subunit alcohol dehydrogenase family)
MSEEAGNGAARAALVTGANRGIGFEVARQLARPGMMVMLGARDPAKGEKAAARLREEGLDVFPKMLDVSGSSPSQTRLARERHSAARVMI